MNTILHHKKQLILVICLFISTIAMNQNIIDTEWKFKLNIPASWSQNAYMDGADKVYDFYSADQNAAASIRIFEINAQVTYEILIPLYEQNMFSAANRIELKDLTSKNGIPAKIAVVEPTGSETHLLLRANDQDLTCVIRERENYSPGQEVKLTTDQNSIHIFNYENKLRIY